MSIQAAKDFVAQTDHDAVIRKMARERFGEIVEVGGEHGYAFTQDEFGQVMRERKATLWATADSSTTCQCGTCDQVCETDTESDTESDTEDDGACVQTCQCGGDAEK